MNLTKRIQEIINEGEYKVIANEDYHDIPDELEKLFEALEGESLIDFSVKNTCQGGDWYLQADYYCDIIGHTIILLYEFETRYSSVEEIVYEIERTNEIIKDIESKMIKQ